MYASMNISAWFKEAVRKLNSSSKTRHLFRRKERELTDRWYQDGVKSLSKPTPYIGAYISHDTCRSLIFLRNISNISK